MGQNSEMSEVIWSQGNRRVSKAEVKEILLIDGAVVSLYIGLLKYLAGSMVLRAVGRVALAGRIERQQS